MDQLFKDLKGLVKISSCVIDNHIFRLHYRATVVILLAFSLMVTGLFNAFDFNADSNK